MFKLPTSPHVFHDISDVMLAISFENQTTHDGDLSLLKKLPGFAFY